MIDRRKDPRAASAGSILVTRLMGGVAGVVTDGGFRDSPDIARLAPAYHQRPSAPTNLTIHQALDINIPIAWAMPRSGPATWSWATAKVWPSFRRISPMRSLTRLSEMTAFEDFVTEEVGKGRSIPGLYPATDEKARSDFAA